MKPLNGETMRIKNIFLMLILQILFISFFMKCDNATEPKEIRGTVTGTVKKILSGDGSIIHQAYIFLEDSLVATTNESGEYTISSIEQGSYFLICSSLGYRDTTTQVQVVGGKTVTHDFYLIPDSSTGKIYGEFQDMTLFNNNLETNPSLVDWDAKQIFSDITGATIQAKTLMYDVPERKVLLGDSLLAITDSFGQYWVEIQCGTYCLKGCCEGYKDATQVIKVLPDTRVYVNFFLYREAAAKLASK
jgi:hypothetical protein